MRVCMFNTMTELLKWEVARRRFGVFSARVNFPLRQSFVIANEKMPPKHQLNLGTEGNPSAEKERAAIYTHGEKSVEVLFSSDNKKKRGYKWLWLFCC